MFHLRSPLGQYKLTFDKAKETCANEDATMATYNQLAYAQKVGSQLVGTMLAGSAGEELQALLNMGMLWLLPSWRGVQEAPGATITMCHSHWGSIMCSALCGLVY